MAALLVTNQVIYRVMKQIFVINFDFLMSMMILMWSLIFSDDAVNALEAIPNKTGHFVNKSFVFGAYFVE
jgi:hypothetical protein